jgi:hypothetical protein
MRKSQIYIEGQRLELFEDEQIKVQSSIQDVFSIDSTKTDFTQSFTIPASEHNNQIMNHFYNNDVDYFNGIQLNYNIRRKASIEIDLVPFKTGKIQLEKATIINGQVQNYQICFYGDLVSLKDILGEVKLSELDYTAYTHVYNQTNVIARTVDNTAYDVRYPLITSSRVWDYNGPDNTNNIDHNSGAINTTELFPALRISSIFEQIQTYFDITIDSLFAQTKNFYNAYLYLKNKDVFSFKTATKNVDLVSTTDADYFNLSLNETILQYLAPTGGTIYLSSQWNITLDCTPTVTGSNFYIDVYSNSVLQTTITAIGTGVVNIMEVQNVVGLSQNVTFKLRADVAMSIDVQVILQFSGLQSVSGTVTPFTGFETADASTTVLTGNLDVNSNMPNMKVYDFVAGVLKEFNMVIYGTGTNIWKAEPLENWYALGDIYDITEFTDINSIDIERVKLYKKISFEHEKSESFMNRVFADNFAREYGSLDYVFPYDGDELTIKLPFENMLFQQFETTNIQVGYALTKFPDYKPYIPKPTILYLYDQVTCSPFKFHLGGGHVTKTTYLPFGQDLKNNGINYSLNFGNDISSLLNTTVPNSNFMVYYFTYLNNLFQQKNRITYVKTKLPLWVIIGLRLNDRLVIRGKRYIINSMATNLSNTEVDFVLLNDFRPINIKAPKPVIKQPVIKQPIQLANGVKEVNLSWTDVDVTVDAYDYTHTVKLTTQGIVTINTSASTESIIEIAIDSTLINGTIESATLVIYEP